MKVVINDGVGGFGLSEKAFKRLVELGCTVTTDWENEEADIYERSEEETKETSLPKYEFVKFHKEPEIRKNTFVIQVIEELKEEANGEYANLKIIDIPDDVEFGIGENEMGYEWVYERHRTWR